MSEMIERVAVALHEQWQGPPPSGRTWAQTCDKLPVNADWFRRCAKAAIEAMREPTRGMVGEGGGVGYLSPIGNDMAKWVWDEMVIEALRPTDRPSEL